MSLRFSHLESYGLNLFCFACTTPPFFKNAPRGGFEGDFRRTHIICAIFFLVLFFLTAHPEFCPCSQFSPLAKDPPQCKGDVAFPVFFWTFLIFAPRFEAAGIPEAAGVR